jgi:2-oxo-4-hydroxy-4-carboxy--5-ureidoimidazoline (OHCU) decarboxylase
MTTPEDGSGRQPMAAVNEMAAEDFVKAFGSLCGVGWIAPRLAAQRPFASRHLMLSALAADLRNAPEEDQKALLAYFAAGAKLPEDDAETAKRRSAYEARFGQPFIMAPDGGRSRDAIRAALDARLHATLAEERETAIDEIVKIVGARLDRLVADGPGGERAA